MSILTGSTRSEVAVGTWRLASIFSTILVATPLIFSRLAPFGASGSAAFAAGTSAFAVPFVFGAAGVAGFSGAATGAG